MNFLNRQKENDVAVVIPDAKVQIYCKNTKIWMKAAIMRAIRTIAQTFVATVGTAAVMSEVNWKIVISATVLAGFLSIATSLTGLPECEEKEKS